MMMWKTSVVTVSDRLFPGLAYHDRKKEFYNIGMHILRSALLLVAVVAMRNGNSKYLHHSN